MEEELDDKLYIYDFSEDEEFGDYLLEDAYDFGGSDEIVLLEDSPSPVGQEGEVMSPSEALDITMAIRSTTQALYVLLYRAHTGKAYEALGYDSWKEYIGAEFDFTVSRSYQLLDLARVSEALEESLPEGTKLEITEAQARDIKKFLPEIKEKIQEETRDLSSEDSLAVAKRLIEEERKSRKAKKEEDDYRDDYRDLELPAPKVKDKKDHWAELEEEANEILKSSGSKDLIIDDFEGDDYPTRAGSDSKGDSPESPYGSSSNLLDLYSNAGSIGSSPKIDLSEGFEEISKDTESLYTFFTMAASIDRLPSARDVALQLPTALAEKVIKNLEKLPEFLEELKAYFPSIDEGSEFEELPEKLPEATDSRDKEEDEGRGLASPF